MGLKQRLKLRWRAWRYRLRLDAEEIALVRATLQPGDVAVDIGAHKGAYTYWMAKGVGGSGRVFSFEPQPVLCRALQGVVAGTQTRANMAAGARIEARPRGFRRRRRQRSRASGQGGGCFP